MVHRHWTAMPCTGWVQPQPQQPAEWSWSSRVQWVSHRSLPVNWYWTLPYIQRLSLPHMAACYPILVERQRNEVMVLPLTTVDREGHRPLLADLGFYIALLANWSSVVRDPYALSWNLETLGNCCRGSPDNLAWVWVLAKHAQYLVRRFDVAALLRVVPAEIEHSLNQLRCTVCQPEEGWVWVLVVHLVHLVEFHQGSQIDLVPIPKLKDARYLESVHVICYKDQCGN
jgi:hypothetical protein